MKKKGQTESVIKRKWVWPNKSGRGQIKEGIIKQKRSWSSKKTLDELEYLNFDFE